MANEDTTYILKSKMAIPNKLLQDDGTITDLMGNVVVNPVTEYNNKQSLPNKFLNPDGTYSTLNEIISGAIDTELFVIVEELPEVGNPQKIYLVPDGEGGFVEYHFVNDKWDPIGLIHIDLSNYSTTQEMMNAIEAAVVQSLKDAKEYTDGVADTTLKAAKKYADTKAGDAVTTANGYTDTQTKSAKDYTDAQTKSAKEYSDSQLKTAKEYTDAQIKSSITDALGGEY